MPVAAVTPPRRRIAKSAPRRRKSLLLNQAKLDRAMEVFRVKTEAEAVDRALDLAVDYAAFERQVMAGMDELVGKGGFTNYFDPPSGGRPT